MPDLTCLAELARARTASWDSSGPGMAPHSRGGGRRTAGEAPCAPTSSPTHAHRSERLREVVMGEEELEFVERLSSWNLVQARSSSEDIHGELATVEAPQPAGGDAASRGAWPPPPPIERTGAAVARGSARQGSENEFTFL